jgi:hypothetical protein
MCKNQTLLAEAPTSITVHIDEKKCTHRFPAKRNIARTNKCSSEEVVQSKHVP